jgi:hypothetical protein
MDVFARTQGFVELDRRIVADIGLNKYDVRAQFSCDLAQLVDQSGSDPLTAISIENREIININLGAFLLELFEDICCETADDLVVDIRDECDESIRI